MATQAPPISRAQAVYRKMLAAKERNERVRRALDAYRAADPLEQAKTFLRQRGWHCFNENILPGKHSSKMIVVGNTPRAPEEVIALAERLKAK